MVESVLDFDGFEIPDVPTLQGLPQAMPLPSRRTRRAQPTIRHTRARTPGANELRQFSQRPSSARHAASSNEAPTAPRPRPHRVLLRSRLGRWWTRLSRFSRHGAFWICMLLLLAQCFQWGFVEQLTRLLASVALVSERASVAAAGVLDHGAELASTTSSAVIAFTTGSMDLVRTAWIGIDLLDLRCTSTEGSVMGAHGSVLADWLNSTSGHAATRTNRSEVLVLWASLVTSVGVALPHVASTASDLDVDGLFWTATGSAHVLPNGYLMFAFRYVEVRFVPQWANPLWQALSVDITAQHDQIQRLVSNVSASLPAASHPLASTTMVDVSWMHLSMRLWLYAQVLLRAVMLHFRSLLTVMATLRGCGLMVVFLAGMGGFLLRTHCRVLSVWRSWTVMGPRGFRAVWWSFIGACQTLR